jgi:hypothetical protein
MRMLIASVWLLALPAAALPCTDLPVLFVVQDKSGSMNFAPDGTAPTAANPSKWSIAQTVVPTLATQFTNRFRFGAEMFPGATSTFNCTTGAVVAAVSGTPAGVQSAYLGAQAGGGTPTASSLNVARSYLQSLALTTPAYVLLITDGLPNCNLSLNPGTCTATTPGCGNNSCGLGAKDCLDDNDTVAAARALFAAGIKVFVVGFDPSLTAGNNKAVLDAVAAAGGTSHAYVASNQAQLTATLNQIALNTATCCHDACTAGVAQCTASGQRQTCALDTSIGCTTWTTTTCPTMSTCANGQCTSCQNQCTAGALRCSAVGDAEQCVTGVSGCTEWSTAEVCVYGELCNGGHCSSCQACPIGASRCTATGGVESCAWDILSGCTTWKASACAPGAVCQNGSCAACNTTCTAGATRCNGNGVETCAADASGCTKWSPTQTCATFCSGGACGTCGTSCAAGATRCDGAGVETCIIDANHCPAWGPTQHCAPNSVCAAGVCAECSTTCAQGTKRCGVNGVTEECRLGSSGCTDFVATGQCAAGERCEQGACVAPCHDTCAAGAGQCTSDGLPQTCVRAPSGCLAWQEQPACDAESVCSAGVCLTRCTGGELEGCPLGMTCVGVPEGRVCVPAAVDGGTADAGSPSATAADAGDSTITSIGAHPGCGCSSFDGAAAPLIALLAWRRRRRSPRT